MKTIKQILESHNIKEDTLYHNFSYLYESIVKAMNEFGEQSFDVAINWNNIAEISYFRNYEEYLKVLEDGQNR